MTEKLAFPFDSIITRQSHKLGIYYLRLVGDKKTATQTRAIAIPRVVGN